MQNLLFYVFFSQSDLPSTTYQELHQVVWCSILLYGQQCLNMSLKSPLPSFSPSEDSSETIIIWSYKRDAAASPKRTLWRLMTVHPTSINLKSLKNVIFQLLFFLGFPRLVLCIRIAYSQLILRDGHNRMNIYLVYQMNSLETRQKMSRWGHFLDICETF